jgi:pimeloyl-ACP methyl ester carboxylesterase/class 3 adenylate cyclase
VTDPETRYAVTVDGVHIAYQVHGQGPLDLVWVQGFADNIEVGLEVNPYWQQMLAGMAARWRMILFDKRGTGLSDRQQTPDLEKRADDLRAVLDAVGSRSAVLCGESEGGALAAFFAATYPDRVAALVLVNGWARAAWATDYEFGVTEKEFRADRETMARLWGREEYALEWAMAEAPSMADDAEFIRRMAKGMRHSASPGAALEFYDAWYAIDVRAILGAIQAPTLMLCRADARGSVGEDVPAGMKYMADRIPGARYVHVPGRDYVFWLGDSNRIILEIEEFLRAQRAEQAEFDRVLATVLFTDIVASTDRAAEMGDRPWKELLERHHQVVRAMLGRYRGVEVATAGDGFLATFDGPGRAVRCAQAIIAAMQPLGVEIRAGVHTGEIERMGDNVGGLAVHVGARVGSVAGSSEVVVSSTVRDLVVGSELAFDDLGWHDLKGVPEQWHLYRVIASNVPPALNP